MIFEFSAIFTCYSTYYKPITKKVVLACPCVPARARGRAESIFKMIFEFSAVFTCYSTYYKPIAKKVGLALPRARRGRAVRAKCFFLQLFYRYNTLF